MLKNDYMKEIETTLKNIKEEVDKSILNGETDTAFNMINKEVKALVGLEVDTINTLAFSDVIELVRKENQYNSERYIAFGELLYFQGYLYNALSDDSRKIDYYQKSLESFYCAYIEEEYIEKKYLDDIMNIVEDLSQYELSVEDNARIFRFYEVSNQLDKAEDVLFHMIKDSDKDKNVISRGIEFYNRLKKMDEHVLEEGNLPLDEVMDGLENLKSMTE
ncbi:DUF6483 family protein [Clostridium cibarium]|uniref:Tetratricopeptide repeat protein n=1 Tax=Clostridium cibarium TaxID=2762247 RepID=A0ABR8PWM2_9CLOT|nr:DUF6483 family protein [Clostridium cibarium]MBD7912559.1 tetratricopeptide repeat protein [Clostridium cibarium]